MSKFFIEHPTKGILIKGPWQKGRWVWSWSKLRSEAMMFEDHAVATAVLELLPPKIREESYVMEYGKWERGIKK